MIFDLTILGSNGAVPTLERNPTAQLVQYNGLQFLVDCGEGTQKQMIRFGVKRSKLDHIFISHLHGDHYYGLMPLITSFNLNHREDPLYIYGPEAIKDIIHLHLKVSRSSLRFPLHFFKTQAFEKEVIFENDQLQVISIPLRHRIPTTGFMFREKDKLRKILPEKLRHYAIPYTAVPALRAGKDYLATNGQIITNAELTEAGHRPRSYAFCSDTIFCESIIPHIAHCDLLYHEATFTNAHAQRAKETYHATAAEAATIAQQAKVGQLLLGHFSARYGNLEELALEAKNIFPNSTLAIEGERYVIDRDQY